MINDRDGLRLAKEGGITVRRPVLHAIGLTVLCICSFGCNSDATPTPTVEVRIFAPSNQTQMAIGEETVFFIEIEPPSLKAQVRDVNVYSDRKIECRQSEEYGRGIVLGPKELKLA